MYSRYSRYMKIHLLITLSASAMFHKSRVATLDLDTASSLLLNMLDVSASMTHNLCSQIKSWKGLKINWDTLFRPFALAGSQSCDAMIPAKTTYPSKFISLNCIWFSTSETSLIDQVW